MVRANFTVCVCVCLCISPFGDIGLENRFTFSQCQPSYEKKSFAAQVWNIWSNTFFPFLANDGIIAILNGSMPKGNISQLFLCSFKLCVPFFSNFSSAFKRILYFNVSVSTVSTHKNPLKCIPTVSTKSKLATEIVVTFDPSFFKPHKVSRLLHFSIKLTRVSYYNK